MPSDESSDEPQLTPQEAELLRHLEDLQANNPAEYEMLVSQLGGGGGGGAPPGGQKVVPKPGFVAKTHSYTRRGTKVFINVCQSVHVDPPSSATTAATSGDELPMRIPLSLGPPREDLDRAGGACTVYDVVFHPDTVSTALADADFRSLMLQLAMHQIKEKHGDDLSDAVSFPRIKGNYKGLAPLPQFMRARKEPAADPGAVAEPGAAPAPAAADAAPAARRPLIEEVAPAAGEEALPAPAYAVEPCVWRDGLVVREGGGAEEGGGPGGGVECLSVKLHLPEVEEASEVEVELSCEELLLTAAGKYRCALLLPRPVELAPLLCRFETRRRIMSVALRCVGGGAALDGEAGGGAASEAVRREREARQRARRRLARSKQEQASRRMGEEGAGETEGEAAEGEAAAAAPAEAPSEPAAPPPSEEAAEAEPAAAAEVGQRQAPLVLSNSIAFELQE